MLTGSRSLKREGSNNLCISFFKNVFTQAAVLNIIITNNKHEYSWKIGMCWACAESFILVFSFDLQSQPRRRQGYSHVRGGQETLGCKVPGGLWLVKSKAGA